MEINNKFELGEEVDLPGKGSGKLTVIKIGISRSGLIEYLLRDGFDTYPGWFDEWQVIKKPVEA